MPLSKEEEAELAALEAKVSARATPRQMAQESTRVSGRLGIHPDNRQQPKGDTLEEFGGRVTDKTGSPLLGTAARMAPDIATSFMGFGAGGAAARAGGEALASPMARSLMHSALKPVPSTPVAQAERAVTTMLNEGENVTLGGIRSIQNKITDLEGKINDILKGSKATVNLRDVGQTMAPTEAKMLNRTDWESATKAVRDVYEGMRTNPRLKGSVEIPVKTAQELKQGIYKQIGDASFGEFSGPTKEGLKAAARGLRGQIGEKVPEVVPLTQRESDLINVLKIGERRVATELRNNHGGIMWLAENPKAAAGFMMDKSSAFKSWFANFMNQKFPGWAERAGQMSGAGGTMSLQEISRDNAGPSAGPF